MDEYQFPTTVPFATLLFMRLTEKLIQKQDAATFALFR